MRGVDNLDQKISFETFFLSLNTVTETIQNEKNITYLEALINSGELIFQGQVDKELSEVGQKKIASLISQLDLSLFSKEEIRKVFQLAILKGMKEATQPNHAMTPDAVCLFISYLVNIVTESSEQFRILDPAIGSGNLLTAILNNSNKIISSYGIEPDETLLQLAYVSANLQEQNLELFHQDSLQDILVDPVDLVVADLPIGHYPNEEIAAKYQLKSKEGMSLTHHLMIEQSINYTKQGGFLLFIIPNFMFETKEAKDLHAFIKEHTYIYSLLQLPKSMFKDEKHGKSIFIVRKKGNGVVGPSQALLAELPSFSNKQALTEMLQSISKWFHQFLS